jgi:hypothetical protein
MISWFILKAVQFLITLPRSGTLSLAVPFRARETSARVMRVARATVEHRIKVQSSLTRREGIYLATLPALKDRAKFRRRSATSSCILSSWFGSKREMNYARENNQSSDRKRDQLQRLASGSGAQDADEQP